MEFNEKLQELRKNKGITQEELAEALFVSRTAISKWESGRGYPSIDSLKEIAAYFSITIDELLSGEALLDIAEKENRSNLQKAQDLLFGIADVFYFLLILLPLYPKPLEGHIYSINLIMYTETAVRDMTAYWAIFIIMIILGVIEIVLTRYGSEKSRRVISQISMVINVGLEILLILSRMVYAATLAFILLLVKGFLMLYNN